MNVTVKLNKEKIIKKAKNDKLGKFAALEWKRLIDPYTPRNTGNLIANIEILPFKIHYKSVYAHYMYKGIVYVDPETGVAGFLDPIEGWKSRKHIKKVPSKRHLSYVTDKSPFSTDHWDKKAEKAGQKEALYRAVNSAIKTGKY